MQPPSYSDAEYSDQLNTKIAKTNDQFKEFCPPPLVVFRSPQQHFRMRTEFKIWHSKETNDASYVMHRPGSRQHFAVTDFPIASATINQLMPTLLTAINNSHILKHKLFQCDFLTTTTGEALITLIYHKALDTTWETAANDLAQDLNCSIVGRSRKQKLVIGKDFVTERFTVAGKTYEYQQLESSFTQPNASVCEHMLNWAVTHSKSLGGDLLELYCGNGNFTLPLAANFTKVLATEIAKPSVKSALHNMSVNQCGNIEIVRMSSEEFTQALNGERAFTRLQQINLDDYAFSTIFVDPPRAGLDPETEALAARFDNILYISCNPDTLALNLQSLTRSHIIAQFALFDQFPYTEHRECGVLLTRR